MKKILSTLLLSLSIVSAYADKEHTIDRGETLESIARKYGVTPEDIKNANPNLDMFFTGMVIIIPDGVISDTVNQVSISDSSNSMEYADVKGHMTGKQSDNKDYSNNNDEHYSSISPIFMLEYGFLPKFDGTSGSNFAYAITVGANYYFKHKPSGAFVGARIGYNSSNYNGLYRMDIAHYSNTKTTCHLITMPIAGGFSFTNYKHTFGVTPLAGFDLNLCVAGKSKTKDTQYGGMESKIKKQFAVGFRLGAELRLWQFNVGFGYVIPINKAQKRYFGEDGYCAVNLGFGF